MAIIKISKAGRTKSSLNTALTYIADKNKTTMPDTTILITALNCWGDLKNIYETMLATKAMYRKDKDNINSEMYKHFQQSFKPGETDPLTAHKIGQKWADINFAQAGFEVCLATHIDKDHIHNHFIINSVNAITGKTLEIHANKTLEQLKASSDALCLGHGLSIIERQPFAEHKNNLPIYSMKKRYSVLNEKFRQLSWQQQIYTIVQKAMADSAGKGFAHFEQQLKQNGISLNYKRLRDDLIFTLDAVNRSISDRILANTFLAENTEEMPLRCNIERIVGSVPTYELEKEQILSVKKQGFYKLIENLIKVIDSAALGKERKNLSLGDFIEHINLHGWDIIETETGMAFYSKGAKRYLYDSTIYKITHDAEYCPSHIVQMIKAANNNEARPTGHNNE